MIAWLIIGGVFFGGLGIVIWSGTKYGGADDLLDVFVGGLLLIVVAIVAAVATVVHQVLA